MDEKLFPYFFQRAYILDPPKECLLCYINHNYLIMKSNGHTE